MSLLGTISKLFKHKQAYPKEPSAFFSGGSVTELIDAINTTASNAIGLTSLETLTIKMAEISKADYVLIARMTDESKFRTLCISNKSDLFKKTTIEFNIEFLTIPSKNYTTLNVDSKSILEQLHLPNTNGKAVSAVLISDTDNTPLGVVLGIGKAKNSLTISNVLRFFSYNASTEIKHLLSKEKLETKNKKLLRAEEELKLKNQLLDNLNKNMSKAKQVVDESSRLKSAFLANLSHEIRTPMNVIMGFTELLSAENMSADQRRNYIDIIQQNGTRLLHIMDSLIDISRFQAKNIGKEQQAFSVDQMMEQLNNNFQSEIDLSGKPLSLILERNKTNESDIVILDKEATYKVMNHLLDNAVKFTASGTISFGYELKEKQILFYVQDTGIGVPDGKEKEIFDLFRQGDLRLSRQFGGTGLGLAIAKRYVNAMNGQIWCKNNSPQAQGATFKFSLPLLSTNEKVKKISTKKHPRQIIESATAIINDGTF